ncbi:MAG: DUF115 domain-containing protein [Spirochaetes bacterium]|nr:DUF115 domain-containing protein [Spirochaetota bacterium]
MSGGDRLARLLAALPSEAAAAIRAAAPDPSFELLPTPSGEPTARWRGALLHSPRDPRREARALVEHEAGPDPSAAVVLGLGLGYMAEAFREVHPGVPLVVVEPDAGLVRAVAEARDLAPLAADPMVRLVIGADTGAAAAALDGLPVERLAVLRLVAEIRRNPSSFRSAEGAIQSFQLRREINANTLARFGRLWVRNLAANLGTFLASPGVGELAGLFDGVPAVVLAGGPTLDELMPLLPRIAERALLVSVNTPLAACLAAGVHPDCVVVVDPQFWASRYLDWTSGYHGWIVAEPSTHPRVFRRRSNRVFIASSLFPLGERLEEAVGAKGKLGAGGSVSTAAWDLARLMGARPIHAAGLDLSFPGLRTHCRGTFFGEARRAAGARTAPLEGWAFASLRDIGLFPAPSAAGGTVPSDRRMLLYRWWFENQLLMHPDLPAFTLSDRGVAIEGMPPVPPETLLDLPPIRSDIEAAKRGLETRLDAAQPPGPPPRLGALQAEIVELCGALDGIARLADEGVTASGRLARAMERGADPRTSLEALDNVDRRILEVSSRSIAGFLVQGLIRGIEADAAQRTGAADWKTVVATSTDLYRGIGESARFQAGLLGRARLVPD